MSDTMRPTVLLTQEQVDFYHREGYLALDAITTPEEVEWLRSIYDRLFEARAGREVGDQFDLGGCLARRLSQSVAGCSGIQMLSEV